MSGLTRSETSDLFDPTTKQWVGVIDLAGNEQLIGTLTPAQAAATQSLVSGGKTAVSSSRVITTADSGATLTPTVALTLTIPAGLSPMASFTVDCPAAGTISVAVSGGATINGAVTTLTRTRAANPVGFVVLAHQETDTYGVSGA